MSAVMKSRAIVALAILLLVGSFTLANWPRPPTQPSPSAINTLPKPTQPPSQQDAGLALHDAAAEKIGMLEAKINDLGAQLAASRTSHGAGEKQQGFSELQSAQERWLYTPARDRDNHSLTSDQCSSAFPKLYHELDRAAQFWNNRLGGNIAPEHIDLTWSADGGMHCMIYKQQLYIIHSRGLNHFRHWVERSHCTLHQIHRAILTSPEAVPDIEFSIKINDVIGLPQEPTNITVWAFTRNITDPVMDQTWLIPDFNYWAYPRLAGSFRSYQHEAASVAPDFTSKKPALVWRGTTYFNPAIRETLLAQTEGKPWADVHRVNEDVSEGEEARLRISLPDHCAYRFAVHTEGTTWSGRLKYLLSCHSTIFIHQLSWYTHLYHLLVPSGPDQNYVPVSNTWTDLPEKMDELLALNGKAERIADNAKKELGDKYFTPAAQTCYWRQLFRVWREASFEPQPYENEKAGKVRGMTYEEYLFWDKDVLEPAPAPATEAAAS